MNPKNAFLTSSLLSLLGGLLLWSSSQGAPRPSREGDRSEASFLEQKRRFELTALLGDALAEKRALGPSERLELKKQWGPEAGPLLELVR